MDRWGVKFNLRGDKELIARLNGLDRKIKRRIATKAVRAGAKVMVKALRSATPRVTGAARKALGTKVKTYRNQGVTVAISGERFTRRMSSAEKEEKSKWGGPHLHLIEYGTQERFQHNVAKQKFQRSTIEAASRQALLQQKGRDGVSRSTAQKARRIGRVQATLVMRAVRAGRRTGKVRPRPFFKRTVQATESAARAAQIAVLQREIPAAAASP